MNVEVTEKIKQDITNLLIEQPLLSLCAIGKVIDVSKSTMSRIHKGKTTTMNPYSFARLEHFLAFQNLDEFGEKSTEWAYSSLHRHSMNNLRIDMQFKIDALQQENYALKEELKGSKAKLKKIKKLRTSFRQINRIVIKALLMDTSK